MYSLCCFQRVVVETHVDWDPASGLASAWETLVVAALEASPTSSRSLQEVKLLSFINNFLVCHATSIYFQNAVAIIIQAHFPARALITLNAFHKLQKFVSKLIFSFYCFRSRTAPLVNLMNGGSTLTSSDQHVNNLVNRIRAIQQEFATNASSSSRSTSSIGDIRSFDPTNDKDV